MKKTYELEIVNWTHLSTENDPHKYTHNIGNFKTQKAAREFLERNNFAPLFKQAKRPATYVSPQHGTQATICISKRGLWPDGSDEMTIAKKIASCN